ncbi:TPA: glycosyltransferase [Klebsiella pneumoniae]|nr:glycosyltransferase [Klebsiella pneumoniae]HDS9490423.1 glycosyltransferase [Klebsiella pneumoniae subsp. pneumoniae]EIX9320399.1 glycosyltransferase [Klebsiella pneumoniae]MCB3234301.1 glycosyltransferase [Klebsiella pneumoniae]MCM2142024.1 glycosyltransferase [Klebsiella pneumoniae]MCM6127326.1 glycosyltransferase [Klebsiella pneumoniae]
MYTKKISVYIPTHNRPVFLKRALLSLTAQTYKDFQVVICDDGSSFENFRVVKEIVEQSKSCFSDLVLLRNEYPQGACVARNKAINASDGQYVTGLDDDDEFSPERLYEFINSGYLSQYPYLSTGQIVDNGMERIKSIMCLNKETTLDALLFQNVVGNQVFAEKKQIQNIGGFDKNFPAWQDYELWVRLTKEYGSGFKLQCHTYILNISHEINRITTSPKSKIAVDRFIEKHRGLLEDKHIQTLYLQDLINRNQRLTLSDLRKYMNKHNLFFSTKYIFAQKFPNVKNLLKKIIN